MISNLVFEKIGLFLDFCEMKEPKFTKYVHQRFDNEYRPYSEEGLKEYFYTNS